MIPLTVFLEPFSECMLSGALAALASYLLFRFVGGVAMSCKVLKVREVGGGVDDQNKCRLFRAPANLASFVSLRFQKANNLSGGNMTFPI